MPDALVARMRTSSGQNFVELGKLLEVWYYDRVVDIVAFGKDIGDDIGLQYGRHLMPLIKYFDL